MKNDLLRCLSFIQLASAAAMSAVYTTEVFNQSKQLIYHSIPDCVFDLAELINQYVALDVKRVTKGVKLWSNRRIAYFVISNIDLFSVSEWMDGNRTFLYSAYCGMYCNTCLSPFAGAHDEYCLNPVDNVRVQVHTWGGGGGGSGGSFDGVARGNTNATRRNVSGHGIGGGGGGARIVTNTTEHGDAAAIIRYI